MDLDLSCIDYNYDITKQQPQLFVNRDWDHLIQVLENFADTMAFRKGGFEGLKIAIESKSISTAEFSSGIQVSGKFVEALTDDRGQPVFIKTEGETSLSYNNGQLEGHGIQYHKDGYSSVFGTVKGRPVESMSAEELKNLFKLEKNNQAEVQFDSGITVGGTVADMIFKNQILILISWHNCTVKTASDEILFEPSWGTYDMIVGRKITSVYAGTADKLKHNIFPPKSKKIAIPIKYSDKEKELHGYYRQVREVRNRNEFDVQKLKDAFEKSIKLFTNEWLLPLEILELCFKHNDKQLAEKIKNHLEKVRKNSEEMEEIIENGLGLLN